MLLCQFREIAELSDVDIIGGDVNTSAHRERGKAKLRPIGEAWEETLRILPPDLGFNVGPTTRIVTNWRVARLGSL